MKRLVVGTLSVMLGAILLMDSIPRITGYVISGSDGFNLLSILGFVFLICGLALFVLEGRHKAKVIKAKRSNNKGISVK